jgi:hypothetical protein
MYIKYVSNGASEVSFADFLNDVAGILNGTITTTSQLNSSTCNIGDSEIEGSLPTAGLYTVGTVSTGAIDFLPITKKHYAANGSFEPIVNLNIRATTTGGPSLHHTDANGANTLNGLTYPTRGASSPIKITKNWSQCYQIDLWIGDTGIMMAAQGSTLGFGASAGSWTSWMAMWCDFSYVAGYDDSAFAANSGYYPGAIVTTGGIGLSSFGAATDTNSSAHTVDIARANYRRPGGLFVNSTASSGGSTQHHYGNIIATEYLPLDPLLLPPAQKRVYEIQTAAGTGTILYPCQYLSSFTGTTPNTATGEDTRDGQMLNLYRVADNFGSPKNGDRLQVGADYYRVIKAHKTGNRSQHTSTECACYAVPENSIPGPS